MQNLNRHHRSGRATRLGTKSSRLNETGAKTATLVISRRPSPPHPAEGASWLRPGADWSRRRAEGSPSGRCADPRPRRAAPAARCTLSDLQHEVEAFATMSSCALEVMCFEIFFPLRRSESPGKRMPSLFFIYFFLRRHQQRLSLHYTFLRCASSRCSRTLSIHFACCVLPGVWA